ncbi:hypothetical protein AHAS_Ahas18G0175800 [Arachis hypogaea]
MSLVFRVCERETAKGEHANAGSVNGAAPMEGSERGCEGCESDEEACVEGERVAIERVRKRVAIEGSKRGLDARVLRNDEDGRLGEKAAGCNGSHWREGS